MPTSRNPFGIAPESLGLFRIILSVILLVDLFVRLTDLRAMYTDDGMFPRAEVCYRVTSLWNWSFHFGGGSPGYIGLLFALAAAFGLALLIGFETRLATIGSWLLLVSVQHRVPAILSGAEILLRMLLLWAMFLPLESRWSWDGRRAQQRGLAPNYLGSAPICSIASAAILLQMALMYLFSAFYKTNGAWFRGEVVAGALNHDFFGTQLGRALLPYPGLLTVLTWGTLVLEWIGPVILLLPKAPWKLRLSIVAGLACMHLGIMATLDVGLFSCVALAGLSLFIPAEFWSRVLKPRWTPPHNPYEKPGFMLGKVAQSICLGLLAYVLVINFTGVPGTSLATLGIDRWKPLTTTLGLAQRWAMFDATPTRSGWYVARATLRDGTEVDLLRQGAPVEWRRQSFPPNQFPNWHWKKLFREMAYFDEQGFQVYRAPVAKYLCQQWNAQNPPDRQINEFDLIYCQEPSSVAGGRGSGEPLRELLLRLDFRGPGVAEHVPGA